MVRRAFDTWVQLPSVTISCKGDPTTTAPPLRCYGGSHREGTGTSTHTTYHNICDATTHTEQQKAHAGPNPHGGQPRPHTATHRHPGHPAQTVLRSVSGDKKAAQRFRQLCNDSPQQKNTMAVTWVSGETFVAGCSEAGWVGGSVGVSAGGCWSDWCTVRGLEERAVWHARCCLTFK